MQFLFSKYRSKPLIGFILILLLVLNTNLYAQEPKFPKPVKSDKVLVPKTQIKSNKTKKSIDFNGQDGPFIIDDSLLYRITKENKLKLVSKFNKDSIKVNVDNDDANSFYVSINSDYNAPQTHYNTTEKIVVISDIEGNYEAFVSFLYANKIIDENHNWIFGNGHLVLNGDFVDRGKNVTQVLWLIYKLEHDAKSQGGNVHFILGNHEILNFYGDYRYNLGKYIKAAQAISQTDNKKEAVKFLYSKHSEIGKWLSTKNVIEKIGDYIFVHGGLNPSILKYNLSLEEINKIVRQQYYNLNKIEGKTSKFLYSTKGPFWHRGLAREKVSGKDLNLILEQFDAKKIVIGHTPTDIIKTIYDGKVMAL